MYLNKDINIQNYCPSTFILNVKQLHGRPEDGYMYVYIYVYI